MEIISIILVVIFLIICLIPTTEDEILQANPRLRPCERHEWVTKPSGIEDNNYIVCNNCGLLPNTDNQYEEQE